MRELVFALLLSCGFSAPAQTAPRYAYVLRLEKSNPDGHRCSLVQASGDFHFELDAGEQTKVFEGRLNPAQLLALQHAINNRTLQSLSQEQIEEPLISRRRESIEISIFRENHWQKLRFESPESQAPLEGSLAPLLGWLTTLEKLPHRELSEDAGKNNCLPPKKLVLQRRPPPLPPSSPQSQDRSPAPIPLAPPGPPDPAPTSMLFAMFSFRREGTGAHQSCMLIADDGQYRFEDRVQPGENKAVRTQISLGRISAGEIAELREILDQPSLTTIRHHEPAGGLVVRMMGDMLRLSIQRPYGVQEMILSSNQRSSGYFYTGDGDLGRAKDLLKFLSEHIQKRLSGNSAASERNDCKQLP